MVAVGDKLGARYFVTRVSGRVAVGSYFEARDAQANVFHAQLLSEAPLGSADFAALGRELASVARADALYLPDELTQDDPGRVYAIYPREPLPPIAAELAHYTRKGDGAASARRALVAAFARLADEYARAAAGRSVHGAIALGVIGCAGRDVGLRLELQGFGVDPAARLAARRERPAQKADAAALFLALHEALSKAGCLPEGAALVKWNVLQSCARGGDHPSLQNTVALSVYLRDLALELSPRAAPTRAAPAPQPTAPAPAPAAPSAPAAPVAAPPAPAAPAAPPKPAAPVVRDARGFVAAAEPGLADRLAPHRARLAVAGGGLLLAGVLAFALRDRGPAEGPTSARSHRVEVGPLACNGESPAAPTGVDVQGPLTALDAVCLQGSTPSLVVPFHVAAGVQVASRAAERGASFGRTVAAHTGIDALGLGGAHAGDAWLVASDAQGLVLQQLRSAGLGDARAVTASSGRLERPLFLAADAAHVWLAATLVEPGGRRVVAVQAPRAGGAPTLFALGEGDAAAIIHGATPTLLTRRSRGDEHAFNVVSVSTTALLAVASGGAADGGAAPVRDVPEMALRRSSVLSVTRAGAVVTPVGVERRGGARYFLLTGADASGAVSLLGFPPGAEPTVTQVTAQGRGLALTEAASGEPLALVSETSGLTAYVRTDAGEVSRAPTALRDLTAARVVTCGGETWAVFARGDARPRVAALPLSCITRAASPR